MKIYDGIIPRSYDDGTPVEVHVKDAAGNVVVYKVGGWRRESSEMMTVFLTKENDENSVREV